MQAFDGRHLDRTPHSAMRKDDESRQDKHAGRRTVGAGLREHWAGARMRMADLGSPPADSQGLGGDRNHSLSSPMVSDASGHQAVLEDFIRAIDKSHSPHCCGQEGRRSVALVEAIYTACRTGKRVQLEEYGAFGDAHKC
jgi:predicted dehydrogenase